MIALSPRSARIYHGTRTALEMIFCSRTIASAEACVANAIAAIAVSGITRNLARMVSSYFFGRVPPRWECGYSSQRKI
jgi:hypothetical protein